MNILLIDVDSKIPNLALMKLSTYHKAKGDTVKLQVIGEYTNNIRSDIIPDKIYASIIFKKNKHKLDGLSFFYQDVKPENIIIGGSGYDLNSKLPDEVDRLKPDYDLYPNCDSSYGYTTRGCNRQCYFCIVPKKEGKFTRYMDPSVFYDKRFDKIFFLDNSILWDKEWFRHVIQFCINNKLKPWFNQGLDIRLIDERDIKLLMKVKRIEMFEFAWDDIKLEKIVKHKIQMMKDCGLNTRQKVQIYTYVDSDNEFESGLYRCNELKKLNVNAFVMFNIDNPRTQRVQDLMRWVNKKMFFWKYSFEEYMKIHHHRGEHRDKGQTDIVEMWEN
jgi:hypothetical protein